MSLFHPRFRLPLWLALVLPLAAYVYRSWTRGFDFRPDLPLDALVLGMFAFVFVLAVIARRRTSKHAEKEPHDEEDGEHDQAR